MEVKCLDIPFSSPTARLKCNDGCDQETEVEP